MLSVAVPAAPAAAAAEVHHVVAIGHVRLSIGVVDTSAHTNDTLEVGIRAVVGAVVAVMAMVIAVRRNRLTMAQTAMILRKWRADCSSEICHMTFQRMISEAYSANMEK